MSKQTLQNKELLTLIAIILLFVVLLSAIGLFFRNRSDSGEPAGAGDLPASITVVEGTIRTTDGKEDGANGNKSQVLGSTAFFLKPTATEVLDALREADPYTARQEDSESPPMKVMWPGYFFSFREDGVDGALVQLDVEENGFGVVLYCVVDPVRYPEVRDLQPGRKIWVAGTVTGIDLDGTGSVHIDVEYIRFDAGPAAALQAERPAGRP